MSEEVERLRAENRRLKVALRHICFNTRKWWDAFAVADAALRGSAPNTGSCENDVSTTEEPLGERLYQALKKRD